MLHQEFESARVMVVAAHPDDEVIGVGGQLARWGGSTVIVHVTDGAPPDDADARASGFASGAEYADARRRELGAALAWLPVQPIAMLRIGATDQRVTHDLVELVRALYRVAAAVRPNVVITHPFEGGHPDHDATAFGVAALHDLMPSFSHLEFACYHEGPGPVLVTNRFADPGSQATRIVLDAEERRLKRLMLQTFRSQQATLRAFGCDEEWVRPAPDYDFSRPPNGGRLWYERFPWGMTGREWCARAEAARTRLREERLTC